MQQQMWTFREELGRVDVSGFSVEAIDGRVGKVDEATLEPGSSYLVVDTGPPLVGKKVLLPAALVSAIDRGEEIVSVDCTEDEVKNAPAFDRDRYREATYQDQVAAYYAGRPDAGAEQENAEAGH
jgi:hypothetical protein